VTLVVSITRKDEYALMSYDSAVFLGDNVDEPGEWETTEGESPKALCLTPYVLLGTIGDHGISLDFRERLRQRVATFARFEECAEAARDVIEALREDDQWLAGTDYASTDGRQWKRHSLSDKHAFTFVLSGFRDDGQTAMLVGTPDGIQDVPEKNGQRIVISCPYGIHEREVLAFHATEDPSLAGAFGHAFAVHHYLGDGHGDRISRDFNCTMLNRSPVRGGAPVLVPVAVDRTDVEGAKQIYETLTTRPPLAA
jgi:hypothetical protein